MKTILTNDGNRRYFAQCAATNRKAGELVAGFTVNVWKLDGRDSYDAGFHVGAVIYVLPNPTAKGAPLSIIRGLRRPPLLSANFRSDRYKARVGYRIRVYPKPEALT